VHEKFTISPYGQYIIGLNGSVALRRYSQIQGQCWGL